MVPEAYVSHRTPRRLRLKVPSRRGDLDYFARLRERLADLSGLEAVEVNPRTASLLCLGPVPPRQVAARALEEGLFAIQDGRVRLGLPERVAGGFNALDGEVRRFTGGELDVTSLVILLLAGTGVYQLARGNWAAPAWYVAFWYALHLFLRTHPRLAREEDKAVRETMSVLTG